MWISNNMAEGRAWLRLRSPGGPPSKDLLGELRGLAMLAILLNHAGGVLVWRNLLKADIGTDMFLLLSGLVLTLGRNLDMDARSFVLARAQRILPAYWIAFTAYWLAGDWLLGRSCPWENVMAHYAGVHAWFGDGFAFSVNDSFWFVSALLGFYGFFLATRSLLRRQADWLLLAAALLAAAVISMLTWSGHGGLMGRLGFRMANFPLGMLLGYTLREGAMNLRFSGVLGLALFVFVYVPYSQSVVLYSAFVGLAMMVSYALFVRPWAARLGMTAVLGFLGAYSLEIFLLHQPLMREYNRYVLARWFGLAEPSDGALIAGIVASAGMTCVLAVELRRLTGWLVQQGTALVRRWPRPSTLDNA